MFSSKSIILLFFVCSSILEIRSDDQEDFFSMCSGNVDFAMASSTAETYPAAELCYVAAKTEFLRSPGKLTRSLSRQLSCFAGSTQTDDVPDNPCIASEPVQVIVTKRSEDGRFTGLVSPNLRTLKCVCEKSDCTAPADFHLKRYLLDENKYFLLLPTKNKSHIYVEKSLKLIVTRRTDMVSLEWNEAAPILNY